MDIKNLRRVKELHRIIDEKRHLIYSANDFISDYDGFFKSKECLEAIKKICAWVKEREQEIDFIRSELSVRVDQMLKECEHTISVKEKGDEFDNYHCLICDGFHHKEAKLVIEGISKEDIDKLREHIMSVMEENGNVIEEAINFTSDEIADDDILVRRKQK